MAGENRAPPDSLMLWQALAEAPYRFDFFQALRRIECADPERPRIGTALRATDDPIRVGQLPSLAFAPAALAAFAAPIGGRPAQLKVSFLGLFGPNGPMPLALTEYAHDRLHQAGDPTLVRFCDLFHHRLLSLFYRAWADAQTVTNVDRPDSDALARRLGSLLGVGEPSLRDRDPLPDDVKRYFAGRLAPQQRNAEGLLAMLSSCFQLPVALAQYIGSWLPIPAADRLYLGGSIAGSALGRTTILGQRVWQCQYAFRLCFGPLSLAEYQRLLPGSDRLRRLIALVRNYVGDELDWTVQLQVLPQQRRATRLGVCGALGWTSWLAGEAANEGAIALVFNPLQVGI